MQMRKFLIAALFFSTPLWAQQTPTPQTLTPDEQAFARLPADLRGLLADLPPRAALQKLDYARQNLVATGNPTPTHDQDRKSTRLNSSHGYISYAVFCLKKKK